MPWKERRAMSLKVEFVERAAKGGANMSALCREYGISRETGHKWVKRFRRLGYDGLEEQSRRPDRNPVSTAEEMVMAVLQAREAHPRWGAKKLVLLLARKYGERTPSRATVERIVKRFGLVRRRRRAPSLNIVERAPQVIASEPNDVWTVDFKGWWRTGDGARCEPLTVRDAFSRYVLAATIFASTSMALVRKEFERLFRKYGIPRAIQCDNGTPFVSVLARGGLTQLSSWWVALGIRIVRSRPGCPQDNGAHERMHRDVSAEVENFPELTSDAEQRALDRWRQQFNHVRPHEALGGKVPADLYKPGTKRTLVLPSHGYPSGWLVRRACGSQGAITLHGIAYSIGRALAGHSIALEPLDELRMRLWLRDLDLGELRLSPSTRVMDRACLRFMERPFGKAKKKVA
jgi:transposase InsO family protein